MDAVLLDTNVFSYLMKPGDTRGDLYRPEIKGKLVSVSFVTVGELYFGGQKAGWGQKKLDNLQQRLKEVVIVPYDRELCETYAKTKAALQKAGISRSDNDLWIASTALRHGIPLITHNAKHFENTPGLKVITKAEPPKPKPAPTPGLFPENAS